MLTRIASAYVDAGLWLGCIVLLRTAWILLREDEVALRLAQGSPIRYRPEVLAHLHSRSH